MTKLSTAATAPGRTGLLFRGVCLLAAAVVLAFGATLGVLHAGAPAKPQAKSAVYPKGPAEMEPLARKDPLEFLRVVRQWQEDRLVDYTCQFAKVERINGELQKPETMQMKFRKKPFSVYLKWALGPSKGQEVLYVEGANKGNVLVRPTGLLGLLVRKVSLDPTSKRALKYSRRPITSAGMANLHGFITAESERAKRNGELALTYVGIRHDGGRPSYVFRRQLPDRNNNPCAVLILYIDQEYLLCVRGDSFDWKGELVSHYWYTDLNINPGLTDKDFDPDNRAYGFRLF